MYKVGILGNCCTHGVGAVSSLNARKDIKIIAGYEPNPRRASEFSNALGFALAKSYEEICENSDVDIGRYHNRSMRQSQSGRRGMQIKLAADETRIFTDKRKNIWDTRFKIQDIKTASTIMYLASCICVNPWLSSSLESKNCYFNCEPCLL